MYKQAIDDAKRASEIKARRAQNDIANLLDYKETRAMEIQCDILKEQQRQSEMNAELKQIHENNLMEQQRQSDIMDIWVEMIKRQESANSRTQRNNYIITFVLGSVTIVQTIIAILDYLKTKP
jgi:hypothetical protein